MGAVRQECKPCGVKIASVFPGGVNTEWWQDESRGGRAASTSRDTSKFLAADDVALAIANIINQPASSDIEEVALEGL
jgi:NADP-dependent 3-hydroxy acid dehydrogenase YdfG